MAKRGVDTLIMTGVTTEVCVSAALRATVDFRYRYITGSDACTSDLHKAALAMIGVECGIFGEIATTAEIMERFADDTDQSVANER